MAIKYVKSGKLSLVAYVDDQYLGIVHLTRRPKLVHRPAYTLYEIKLRGEYLSASDRPSLTKKIQEVLGA